MFAIHAVTPKSAVASASVETLITVVITDTLIQRVTRVHKLRCAETEVDTAPSAVTVTARACAMRSKTVMKIG